MRGILLALFFLPLGLAAQTNEWIGVVIDNDNLPFEGATIQLLPSN